MKQKEGKVRGLSREVGARRFYRWNANDQGGKSGQGETRTERGRSGPAKLGAEGGGRRSAGGRRRQKDGAMGADFGSPLTVTLYTIIEDKFN